MVDENRALGGLRRKAKPAQFAARILIFRQFDKIGMVFAVRIQRDGKRVFLRPVFGFGLKVNFHAFGGRIVFQVHHHDVARGEIFYIPLRSERITVRQDLRVRPFAPDRIAEFSFAHFFRTLADGKRRNEIGNRYVGARRVRRV